MEIDRVNEIEQAIAKNELSPMQVFNQMKQLVYREPPCYAFCEKKAFESKIARLESEVKEQALEYIALAGQMQTYLEGLAKVKADAIREAVNHGLSNINYPYHWSVIRDAMIIYADKLEKGND